ncbi:MAG: FecR family protein [Deltaproteobacteria bacterium]|nr:FecR family protein [Deltaproteobacteria bacterium]
MMKRKMGNVIVMAVILFFVLGTLSTLKSASLLDNLMDNFGREYKPAEPLIPQGINVMPGFMEGEGKVIGNAQMVQGNVVVIHKGQNEAYTIKNGHPLFMGDTLISGERSSLNAKMADKSLFALAPGSKLVLDQQDYDAGKEERASTVSLLFGRARFIVTKLKKSKYQVRTPTAVLGVRGSDFALAVTPNETKLSFLERILASFHLMRKAHAAGFGVLLTTLVTGPGTTAGFAGMIGATQVVGPASICAATSGTAAIGPIFVGAAAASGALELVGPLLASMSMPPGM